MFRKHYATYYDLFNADKPYEKEIKFVYDWAGKPSSVFDIGCGTGNYHQYFPKETFIVGIDKSPSMAEKGGLVLCGDITKFRWSKEKFDCSTALFDVLNYIPTQDWWKKIPIKKGGFFIFDIWDKAKVDKEGFATTEKKIGRIKRRITPLDYDGKRVDLRIDFWDHHERYQEDHQMYLYSHADIVKACGKEFNIVEMKPTKGWQAWYKCQKK